MDKLTLKDQARAQLAVVENYEAGRKQVLSDPEHLGEFGKRLDNKARKAALRIAGVELPEGLNVAWATPEDWHQGGYRAEDRAAKVAELKAALGAAA
jgi:hypothetical protein